MTSIKKTYNLTKIGQLIDLNGDTTNFDISFKVVSKNGDPFDIVVVDQTTLDNSPELQYRTASNGQMSGNIVQDKNVYQNYFISLKSDQPCVCDVEIIKKEIPNAQPTFAPTPKQTSPEPSNPSPKQEKSSWKFWVILGIVVVGCVVLYFVYQHDKKKKNDVNDVNNDVASPQNTPENMEKSLVNSPLLKSSVQSPSPSLSPPSNNLVERLKRLHMNK